ncbi:MAG: phytanoyl-CoA dioxygenase family protein [Proteobacteria bacterium]|nr:phytanoyl-CoA dioxygenase family protein [Pseudomonadota bacterium]
MLTDEQKFLFDLEGYLVIPGVLSDAQCSALRDEADRVWPRQASDGTFRRFEDISLWGQSFVDLMDHPKVLPVLIELIGSRLRIDHDYCIFMRQGDASMPVHGGPRRIETDHWYYYSDGIMRNGLTVATYALNDSKEGDGGFVCIPGSHKTNFMQNLPESVRNHDVQPHYVRNPPIGRGDVLIFTEALMHGTRAWCGNAERRALLYKYSPPHSTWRIKPYDLLNYPHATQQQRRLMAPPSVEKHPRVVSNEGSDQP